jgi:hypothetical protein
MGTFVQSPPFPANTNEPSPISLVPAAKRLLRDHDAFSTAYVRWFNQISAKGYHNELPGTKETLER